MILAITLSLGMLAGCKPSDSGADPAATEMPAPTKAPPAAETPAAATADIPKMTAEELKKTRPNEYVQEKIDAGLEPLVVFVTPVLFDAFIASVNDDFKREFEALGFSYAVQDAQGDMTQMLTLLENAVQIKASAIIILAMTEGLGDTCAKAEADGTHVIVFGAKPSFNVAGLVVLDQYEQGKQACYMIHDWLDQTYADAAKESVHAYITTNVGQEDNIQRSNAYQEYLPEDERVKVVYTTTETTNSIDDGFKFAEEAFTIDPMIRIALTFSTSASIGANNYILANYPDQLAEFGVFCNSQEEALLMLIDAGATSNASCVRGTIAQGGKSASKGPFDCTIALLLGGAEYGHLEYDRIYAVNNFGYEYESKPE